MSGIRVNTDKQCTEVRDGVPDGANQEGFQEEVMMSSDEGF